MANSPRTKFNNATQRLFGDVVTPVVYVWETNDPDAPWYAEARILEGDRVVRKFPQSSSTEKQSAKNLAADAAYQLLCSQYPNVDLTNV
ncbi:hypothetical protein H1R20_g6086, partial [Candolleomyces eurysporus]